jgi:hypothetical protein
MKRPHRALVPTLLVLATLTAFVAAFAVWVNRQALNTENWADTSSELLADDTISDALAAYLVNELFTGVDVAGAIEQQLPERARPLAGPAAAGLRELADRAAPEVLGSPKVQDVWVKANTLAHQQLLRVIDGGGPVVSTQGGDVTLDVHALVTELATRLGIEEQLGAAREQLQGSAGDQARALAQRRLGITVPETAGQLVIMESSSLETAQDVAGTVEGLAIILPLLAIALFALAVWLARGRRRVTLRTVGWCWVAAGALLLLLRRVGGDEIVDSLVKVPSNEAAVHDVWDIATSLLYAIAVAMIAYGLAVVVAAWLGGGTRPATFLRRAMAPTLRERPAAAYGAVAGGLLLLVLWGPTPAFRNPITIAVFAALFALGVAMLRRQTAEEFPDAQPGDALSGMRERWASRRARAKPAEPAVAGGIGTRLDELERLVALHDRGDLSDAEFAAEKTNLVSSSKP